jgi:hypothetical protein
VVTKGRQFGDIRSVVLVTVFAFPLFFSAVNEAENLQGCGQTIAMA